MASRLERLVSIDAHIRAANFPSVEKLCHLFEVQPRTIYQDLRELREMFGLDIRFDRHRNGYYNANPSKQLPPLAMTYEEALLITLAINMLASSLGASFRGALARTVDMLVTNDELQFSWLSNVISMDDRAGCEVKCSVMVDVLRAALAKQKTVLVPIDTDRANLTFFPMRIEYTEGHWNLVGKNGHGDDIMGTLLCEIADVRIVSEDSGESSKILQ